MKNEPEVCPVCGHSKLSRVGQVAVGLFLAVWVAWCFALIALAYRVAVGS